MKCKECHHRPSERNADCGTYYAACHCNCHDAADAAPDLLAACDEIVRQSNMNIDADDPDNWIAAEITRPAIEAVVSAIAKARRG